MTARDIQSHLKEEVSPELIFDSYRWCNEDVWEWQNRALEPFNTIVNFNAIMIKARNHGKVVNKAVYTAIGVNIEGKEEVLGLWISGNEGAKFWPGIMVELKNRGVKDILIACIDGLVGLPEAINAIFSKTRI